MFLTIRVLEVARELARIEHNETLFLGALHVGERLVLLREDGIKGARLLDLDASGSLLAGRALSDRRA